MTPRALAPGHLSEAAKAYQAYLHQAFSPKANGKAGRFIWTALREWGYARADDTSDDRAADLPMWLD